MVAERSRGPGGVSAAAGGPGAGKGPAAISGSAAGEERRVQSEVCARRGRPWALRGEGRGFGVGGLGLGPPGAALPVWG